MSGESDAETMASLWQEIDTLSQSFYDRVYSVAKEFWAAQPSGDRLNTWLQERVWSERVSPYGKKLNISSPDISGWWMKRANSSVAVRMKQPLGECEPTNSWDRVPRNSFDSTNPQSLLRW